MNKSKADSYLQKLKERRLDPIGDPLICGIRVPYPFSSGFSTGEVLEKALAWHQEFAARVRKYQEEPDMPLQERTEAANLLVNLATEATMTVKALSITFPDVFKAVASRKASFPINIPALPEDRDEIIHWLTETLQLGSEHELKLRGRKTFSRRTFANKLLLYCISRIKMRAIELLQFRIDNLFQLEGVELLLEEELELHTPLSKATAGKWMEVIWKLLLADYPAPEKHERLKQFGAHKAKRTRIALRKSSPKSEAANLRAGIRDALLKYLLRMLSDK
ncbi:MAG: hypothetical protein WCA06_19615 [Terrimicrobiaceae bacterium]